MRNIDKVDYDYNWTDNTIQKLLQLKYYICRKYEIDDFFLLLKYQKQSPIVNSVIWFPC